MARTDIARVVARAVLDEIVSDDPGNEVDALLKAAVTVKRKRTKTTGEVVELVYVVPPDPTTPED